MRVIIVGGVAGGASAAARLRRLDEHAEIVVYERGEYISFASCGLPYYIGDEIKSKSALTLQTPTSFKARFNVEVRVMCEVTAIDTSTQTVTVSCGGATYTDRYDKLILSMGASPVVPSINGAPANKVFTLRTIPDTYKIKEYIAANKARHATVVGGGYIGMEMCENLVACGRAVSVIEMSEQLIAPLDYDMACDIHNHVAEHGVELKLKSSLVSMLEVDGRLICNISDGSQIVTDMVVMAVGVRPDTDIAIAAGIDVNERGGIRVNKNMLTSDSNVYAVGDAVEVVDYVSRQPSMIPLAGPANKQGRIAADNICGISSRYDGTQGSAILKVFDMTVATSGINEKTAKRLSISYDKSFTYSSNHASYYPGATNMSIKIIYEPTSGKILGTQIVGYDGVDKRCDVIATCIRAGMTAYDLTRLELCYAPPYGSAKDAVNMAGYVIENIMSGLVNSYHWHDIAALQRRDGVILLDTRTVGEYKRGSIDGYINIPLDSLRTNLDKLDVNKPIYVHCQSGLRSYIACRILSQHGYKCFNLSGGYRLYHSIMSAELVSTAAQA